MLQGAVDVHLRQKGTACEERMMAVAGILRMGAGNSTRAGGEVLRRMGAAAHP